MDKKLKVVNIPILQDNYIWVIEHLHLNQCVVVDPGEAAPVLHYLEHSQKQLIAILVTHKHWDHTGGILELKKRFPNVIVYASKLESLPYPIESIAEGDELSLLQNELIITVYEVPGHTLGHLTYYVSHLEGFAAAFTGDTLFSGGCGRLFEGTFQQLYDSLLKLRNLSPLTKIYCGHEYTIANLKFAHWLEPDHVMIQKALKRAEAYCHNHQATLPSTLEIEYIVNPFLKCDQPYFIEKMKQKFSLVQTPTPLTLFERLRNEKDNWRDTSTTI